MSKALMKELVDRWKVRRATVKKLYDEAMERHDIPGALRLQSRMNELEGCIKNLDGLADQVEDAGTPLISNLPVNIGEPRPWSKDEADRARKYLRQLAGMPLRLSFFCSDEKRGGPGCAMQCNSCKDQEQEHEDE